MTDFCELPVPARASAASSCGSVSPASPRLPILRKLRRETPVAKRAAAIGAAEDRQHARCASRGGQDSGEPHRIEIG